MNPHDKDTAKYKEYEHAKDIVLARRAKKKGLIYESSESTLTSAQMKKAVLPSEMPPCAGNPGAPCTDTQQPMSVKGYDDQQRCPNCNKVHIELVFKESGESDPNFNYSQNKPSNVNLNDARRAAILARVAPKGGFTNPQPQKLAKGDSPFMRPPKPAETPDEQRARIQRMYNPKGI